MGRKPRLLLENDFDALVAAVPENPEADWQAVKEAEEVMHVIVPWSGGLDSTTLAVMAVQAGFNVTLISATMGQPWDSSERRARHFIKKAIPELEPLVNVEATLNPPEAVYGHIHLGRNVTIGRYAATLGDRLGGVAEVWLAWLDGETNIAAGDKSHVVLDLMQAKHETRFALPLRFMTKVDLVDWWLFHGRVDEAANLYSCFTGGTQPCGRCQACFRFYVPFAVTGYIDRIPWLHKADFPEAIIDKYREKTFTSARRAQQTLQAIAIWERHGVRDR